MRLSQGGQAGKPSTHWALGKGLPEQALLTGVQPGLPQAYLSPSTTARQQADPVFTASPVWQWSALPLPVYFNPQTHWQQMLLQQVLQEWSEASQNRLHFLAPVALPPTAEQPQTGICITWQPEPPHHLPFQLGLAKNTLNEAGYIVASHIALIENPAIDQQLSKEQQLWRLRSTLLHELGHALGLEHSACPEHVMYFRGWRNTYLAPGDAAALQRLYPC
jgi:hypothetical protein